MLPLLTCADIERVVFAGADRVVNLGRSRRFFVGGTRRAVEILQPTCVHPTCDVPAASCDIDHVVDWNDGGPTDQDNAEPRCKVHHPKARQKRKARRRTGRTGKGTTREPDPDPGPESDPGPDDAST